MPAIPSEEICPLDDDIEQAVQRMQREANADYDAQQVLEMTNKFNYTLDNAIERLNTMPKQPVIDPPALLDLMVCFSKVSHLLEGFIERKYRLK